MKVKRGIIESSHKNKEKEKRRSNETRALEHPNPVAGCRRAAFLLLPTAMRKAQGLARGRNRRKQQGGDGPAQQQQAQAQGPGGVGGGPANQQHLQHPNLVGPDGSGAGAGGGGNGPMQRRKPSPEEQALTAKNYRLAKELVSWAVG